MGAGFRITGVVERKWIANSGKMAELTLAFPDRGKTSKVKVVAFKDMVARVSEVGQGQTVQVTGGFWDTKLTDKAKNPIQVDGRDVYQLKLTIRTLVVEGEAPPALGEPPPTPGKDTDFGDGDRPF